MKKDLLICIAHHHTPERMKYLLALLSAFKHEYELTYDVIVDTQVTDLRPGIDAAGVRLTIVSHVSLDHSFFLAWQHRKHMRDRIDDYGWFMYVEDDIYLPFENFEMYQMSFELLWPHFVPGFVRVEKHAGEEWAVDITERQHCTLVPPHHCALNQPYHGFWIMSQEALKETMRPDFVRLSDSREVAASYPIADLGRTALVQIDDGKVIRECYAYHLSNSYAPCPTSPHGKIKVSEIFLLSVQARYEELCRTPSDIWEHLPTLKQYSDQCDHVTEFGVRGCVSLHAFLASNAKKVVAYDIANVAVPECEKLTFHNADVLAVDIEPTDMLFIDTYHTFLQLYAELNRHAENVRRWIIMHDTGIFGHTGEDGGRGLNAAILKFICDDEPWWCECYRTDANNGLTILERA